MTTSKKDTTIKTRKENSETTTQFLLAEFNELAEAWRHTDARIDSAINIYLSVVASTFPALGLLYQAFQSIQLFILVSVPMLIILFVFGFMFMQRVTSTDITKAEYILGMQTIRRYFVDQDAEISSYLILPVASPSKNKQELDNQKHPYFHKQLIFAVIIFNSILIGTIIGSLIWLVFSDVLTIANIALISFGFIVGILIVLSRHYSKRVKRKA